MPAARFIDSNVLIYALVDDQHRTPVAEKIMLEGGVVSVQVLNEVANVCSRKLRMPPTEIHHALRTVRAYCDVVPLTDDLPTLALSVMERYTLSYCDALIVASALSANCTEILSEDMQHGLKVVNARIVNPFR
ncbi:MAG: PIN domain-containing protein [Ignavibacteriae bacterium]|nr:MAG: PIN domain-containing protein [Ignavibacteriota bacterium]